MRLFAVDDHPAYLATVGLVVDATPGVELVGTARSGFGALQMLLDADHEASTADVLLVDVVMPEVSGPEFVRRYRAAGGRAGVIFMSSYDPHDLPEHVTGPTARPSGQPLEGFVFVAKNELSPELLCTMLNRVAQEQQRAVGWDGFDNDGAGQKHN